LNKNNAIIIYRCPEVVHLTLSLALESRVI